MRRAPPAPITWDDVEALAPELAEVAPLARTIIIGVANSSLNARAFTGPNLRYARILLAAHAASTTAVGDGAVAAGPVLSETVGGVSRTFADASSSSVTASSTGTTYGDQLAYMIRTSRGRWPFVCP